MTRAHEHRSDVGAWVDRRERLYAARERVEGRPPTRGKDMSSPLSPRNVTIINDAWLRVWNGEDTEEDRELIAYVNFLLDHIEALKRWKTEQVPEVKKKQKAIRTK
jgi:hypothetical protein